MRCFVVGFLAAMAASAQTPPTVARVLNAASYGTHLSPGALASVSGSNLATARRSAESIPLPAELEGTRVAIHDSSATGPISAPLSFVSPDQINFQVPFEVTGTSITITVSTTQGTSAAFPINLDRMAPGLFSQSANGVGDAVAFDTNFKLLTGTPDAGSTIVLYATGLGATTPEAKSGFAGNATAPFNMVAAPFDVYIGGNKATVAWAGLAPAFVGVYQLNVVPDGPAIGDVVISCECPSESNHVRMPQAVSNQGSNTANATGSVSLVYPTGQAALTYSPGFLVAKTTARFDIKTGTDRFTVSAVARIGSNTVDGTTIDFDPVQRQFTAKIPSPSASIRSFDFSSLGSALVALDFTCRPSPCPMPGNIVPIARVDPALLAAMGSVPLPNVPPNGAHSFYTVTGTFTPGSTFVVDSSNHPDLLTFASFAAVPFPGDAPVSVILYIDGQVVDAVTGSYGKHP
jgi:uncharacterized protein (TIGR03437 family)